MLRRKKVIPRGICTGRLGSIAVHVFCFRLSVKMPMETCSMLHPGRVRGRKFMLGPTPSKLVNTLEATVRASRIRCRGSLCKPMCRSALSYGKLRGKIGKGITRNARKEYECPQKRWKRIVLTSVWLLYFRRKIVSVKKQQEFTKKSNNF